MICSHRHRFVFVKTRKTAGTSLEIALSRHCGPDDIVTRISPADEELRAAAGGVPPQNDDTSPSSYAHMGARRVVKVIGRETWDDYFTFAVERNPFDVVASSWRYSARKPSFTKSFAEFVRTPRRLDRLALNERLYRMDGQVVVDRVYRYEELPAAVEDLSQRLGLDLDLPHAKQGSGPHYRKLYGPGDAEIVAERFRRTIREFGYEF
ncbi:hypothetical protein EUA06_17860 [Nocardioides glacieisoli]|uniref:Sulfotransferase family protein n=1 Tax=Nocardioides glacieisoli TaxID=1168730 RepID=A0A4Q2RMZ1_9ACTN|nr:hypothetical protein [Nocardioides glacieisoli]RYB88975.1 hypothetical protein EUA06_17860 [Nocardioides glacieisoli]